MNVIDSFHPAVQEWFRRRFDGPTDAQSGGWPHILAGRDTLITAPTGSGKTLAAFLVSIDRLLRKAEAEPLEDRVSVVYVSPLKALSADIKRNLEEPLEEIVEIARQMGHPAPEIRAAVRTGDTTQKERQEIVKRPPHLLITTPESLYLMVTAERSREILRTATTVIVDEVHALLRDKRGSHLALTLARLDHVCHERPARVGLSATVKPLEEAARFLVGANRTASGRPDCEIVDSGHQRDLDIAIEVPPTDLEAVGSGEQWKDVYDRLAELIKKHRTTLIFVNTRRASERVAFAISERIGEEHVGSHHGSLSKERRLSLERRLKAGDMKALVATASLELGIDIGSVDLVCQLESPRSITTFLQRVGRSGHALGLTPKGRLFPTSRDELVECAAMVRAVKRGRLDRVWPPVAPLDILAQQIVAEAACEPWKLNDLYNLVRSAAPYAELTREEFDEVIELSSEGINVGTGRAGAYLHHDRINGVVKGRRGARMTAIQCGGAIPEIADYKVIAEPEGTFVGTLDEDFSIESMAGDIFLLGTTSWRIRRIESAGIVRVEDAHGAPPTIPFWLGEAPARTFELSEEVSNLRVDIGDRLDRPGVIEWVAEECGLPAEAAEQVVRYIRVEKEMLGVVPSQQDVVFERFFDEAGGQQLVVHAPFGGRINRAWGFALRKRFCVSFDFELQAAANDDAMLLSIGPNNSFPLDDMFGLVKPDWVREAVEQSLLIANAPMWTARWRWNTTRALALLRQRNGKRVPPPIQRMKADDLMAAVFPAVVACQENVVGALPIPDHPLVRQTMHDCLFEGMDLDGLMDVLHKVETGEIRFHAKDTTEPSPFSHEMLNSKPYTYLDDAPLEERRARAVVTRRGLPESARDLGVLDPDAIERVVEEARPDPRDADEFHDALLSLIALRTGERSEWEPLFDVLVTNRRAAIVETDDGRFWFAAENLPAIEHIYSGARVTPELSLPPGVAREMGEDEARLALARGQMDTLGPVTPAELAYRTGLSPAAANSLLAQLEAEGGVLRGHFRRDVDDEEFCNRRLLARIHRYTLDRLRQEIEPVTAQDLMSFLLRWQHVVPGTHFEGKRGLLEAINQMQGFDVPAVAWERHILPARVAEYRGSWLDELCLSGDAAWARFGLKKNGDPGRQSSASSATPISLARRADLDWLLAGVRKGNHPVEPRAGAARDVLDLLDSKGALFYDDIVRMSGRLATDVERGLWDLVSRGLVTADGFQALRSIMASTKRRSFRRPARARLFRTLATGSPSGRWSLLPTQQDAPTAHPEEPQSEAAGRLVGRAGEQRPDPDKLASEDLAQAWAEQLLFRYGVVFRDLVSREGISVPWRDILRQLRRMEAQGIVRGGRFVAGFYGEQYARPEAVESIRRVRRIEKTGELIQVSAVDPLNLAGIITPGAKVPAIHTKSVIFRDGIPISDEEVARIAAESKLAAVS